MNTLQLETSPYLLQHAQNPVHWQAWKPDVLERAKREDKPILVSIGYSTCHWCHVMEHESFENEEIAAFMNEHFINIKVDREERPDIDQIYMEACQAISGGGGWPLNCFLLPDTRPFYAGTYFPSRPAYNRPSWLQVLQNIHRAFHTDRKTVEDQANRLMGYIKGVDKNFLGEAIQGLSAEQVFTPVVTDNIFYTLEKRFDTQDGGFGGAPKFPATMSIQYLLDYHHFTKKEAPLYHALFSLDKMILGGIYDQIGGGFARYATDKAWLIPHFEKMLYDNALLVGVLADAYAQTKKPLYKDAIEETLSFVQRELMAPNGGFYSALDADSEGVEGKFYVWDKTEIDEILGDEAKEYCTFFGVTEEGNWEEKNILNRQLDEIDYCKYHQIKDVDAFKKRIKTNNQLLLKERAKRIRPSLDDKQLLSWNALMATAYAKAGAVFQNRDYIQIAEKAIQFLLKEFRQEDGLAFYHTYKEGQKQYHAFLDDYAFLIEAILTLYSTVFDEELLFEAVKLSDYVIQQFFDPEEGLFFYTTAEQQDIIVRRKEMYDSALPSANSTMVQNLNQLSILCNRPDFKALAKEQLLKIKDAVERYPTSFSRWATNLLSMVYPSQEIAIVGEEAFILAQDLNTYFLPNSIKMASAKGNKDFPLLQDRFVPNTTQIYLCSNYSCQKPVQSIDELMELILYP